MTQQGQFKYVVEMVLCIDATASMSPVINNVKSNALNLYEDLMAKLAEKDKYVDTLRLKVIVFRDYYCDGDDAMQESVFFDLPEQTADFKNFVSTITVDGGGDEPENGLEALALAMRSDWQGKSSEKSREVIVIWTDASAHPLDVDKTKGTNYPSGLPANFDELTDEWENKQGGLMKDKAKRLIIFAPDAYPWSDIYHGWKYVVHSKTQAGKGLEDLGYDQILEAIAGSV